MAAIQTNIGHSNLYYMKLFLVSRIIPIFVTKITYWRQILTHKFIFNN